MIRSELLASLARDNPSLKAEEVELVVDTFFDEIAARVPARIGKKAIRAAVDGQGVALATLALVADLLREGKLVAPLPQRFANPRSYYLLLSGRAGSNPAVEPFRQWLANQLN